MKLKYYFLLVILALFTSCSNYLQMSILALLMIILE